MPAVGPASHSSSSGRLCEALGRCAGISTGDDAALPRVKPFKYAYEKDIVMYAYHKRLDYFSTECVYAPFATRGLARDFIKELEARAPAPCGDPASSCKQLLQDVKQATAWTTGAYTPLPAPTPAHLPQVVRPQAISDLVLAAEGMRFPAEGRMAQAPGSCTRCGYLSSQPVCKVCPCRWTAEQPVVLMRRSVRSWAARIVAGLAAGGLRPVGLTVPCSVQACMLLEGLSTGRPKLGVSTRASKQAARVPRTSLPLPGAPGAGRCSCAQEASAAGQAAGTPGSCACAPSGSGMGLHPQAGACSCGRGTSWPQPAPATGGGSGVCHTLPGPDAGVPASLGESGQPLKEGDAGLAARTEPWRTVLA